MQDTTEWMSYLKLCGKLAKEAARQGESPAGCLIIHEGKVIAKAREATKRKRDVTCHAEMEALRKARKITGKDNFSAFTLLTTHEPCVMCSYAIRFHRVGRVVIGQSTGFLGGVTSPFNLLTSHAVPAHWSSPPEVIFLNPLPVQPQSLS